jgi:hypothetical protein
MSSSVKLTAQQSTYLLLPVAQGGLLLLVRMRMMTVANQSPPQAMTIKSSKPSPLISPAVETETPLSSFTFLPLITKPLVKIFTDTVISCYTGSLNNDGITNNGVITINNLEVGVTWQYSVNGGND